MLLNPQAGIRPLFTFLTLLSLLSVVIGQTDILRAQAKAPRDAGPTSSAKSETVGAPSSYPQLVDITASTGIQFEHVSSPEQKFIVESMSGGVALIDYDRDGWPDIYFTNAQSVDMAWDPLESTCRHASLSIL